MLPEGFEERVADGLLCWARKGLAEGAIAASDPARGHEARGRVRFCAIAGDAPGAEAAVRHYHRGGLLAPLLRDFHLDARRPLREIALYEEARKAGVPTLEPLAGVSRRAGGPLWRCDLLTRAVRGATDFGDLWPALARGGPARRARAIEAVGRSVRALHDAGFRHRDLNLKNVLLVEEGLAARALIIDLDGASRRGGALERAAREENILRLYRSSQKLAGKHAAPPPSPRDLLRFARAYAGEDEEAFRALAAMRLPGFRIRRLLWPSSQGRPA